MTKLDPAMKLSKKALDPRAPSSDLVERLRKAMDGVTPGPWVAKQTVIHGNEYGGWWLEGIDLEPEDATRPERLVLISGSGGARSYTTRIIDRQIHDDNEANMKWFALCSPDNIGALLDENAAQAARIAELEGALTQIASRSGHTTNPDLDPEVNWGNYDDVFSDGEAQANFECADIARRALASIRGGA